MACTERKSQSRVTSVAVSAVGDTERWFFEHSEKHNICVCIKKRLQDSTVTVRMYRRVTNGMGR